APGGIPQTCNPPANNSDVPPPDPTFCPHDPVTRGQMAAFLVRALQLTETGPGFTDTTDSVFATDISRLAQAGITKGCNPPANTKNGTPSGRDCGPHDAVARGQTPD